jgi:hypothetical protein
MIQEEPMNQKDKAAAMKKEIRAVSNYKAMRISKYYISICLFLSAYVVGYFDYAASPVYILLVYLTLPSILAFAFQDYAKRYHNKFIAYATKEEPFLLNSLKQKYHYTRTGYTSNSISFVFILILLCTWLYNLSTIVNVNLIVFFLPVIIIAGGVLIRLFGSIIYQIKIPYDISHIRL